MASDTDKKVVGLYGEMRFAMELHERGWQVYRAYIDETFDFVIMKCYCYECDKYTNALKTERSGYTERGAYVEGKVVTNLCEECEQDTLRMLIRFVQVKTSEGIEKGRDTHIRSYSFHPKLRYHLADGRVYYVWIQVYEREDEGEKSANFFIFHTDDVKKFDDISLDSYKVTDNQKISIHLSKEGKIFSRARKYDYKTAFAAFLDRFDVLDDISEDEKKWRPECNEQAIIKGEEGFGELFPD